MPQTALITGVGRQASIATGIVTGIARRLAADCWNLALAHWPAYDTRMPWDPQSDDTPASPASLTSTGIHVSTHIADLEDPATRAACLAHQPAGRLGTPADVASTVAFVLSD